MTSLGERVTGAEPTELLTLESVVESLVSLSLEHAAASREASARMARVFIELLHRFVRTDVSRKPRLKSQETVTQGCTVRLAPLGGR